jgi:hypothetical protein
VNRHIAEGLGLSLEAVLWEIDAYPGFHADRPQNSVLNIQNCDILIGIFWKRFGTPIKEDGRTATEHEISKAYEAWKQNGKPHILLYFNQVFEKYNLGDKSMLCLWRNGYLSSALRERSREQELQTRLSEWLKE